MQSLYAGSLLFSPGLHPTPRDHHHIYSLSVLIPVDYIIEVPFSSRLLSDLNKGRHPQENSEKERETEIFFFLTPSLFWVVSESNFPSHQPTHYLQLPLCVTSKTILFLTRLPYQEFFSLTLWIYT